LSDSKARERCLPTAGTFDQFAQEERLMISRFLRIVGVIAGLLSVANTSAQDYRISEVYRDDRITISAEIVDLERQIIHFGDVLTLALNIDYDPKRIRIQELDSRFFTGAWSERDGAFLLHHQSITKSGSGQDSSESRNLYRFQILACPEGAVLCRGNRRYEVPEFTLEYELVTASDSEIIEPIKFRPWPAAIVVGSAIPLDEEGELNSFLSYFPTGAFPSPLSGLEQESPFTGLIAGGMFLLLGGLLMSPLSFFKRSSLATSKQKARWEHVLEKLKAGEFEDEAHFMDNLRRCMVWYCVDELAVDPFYWVKHESEVSGKQKQGAGELAEMKELFIQLSHNPQGEGKVLLERLSQLISKNK